jgi:hypothetical protein
MKDGLSLGKTEMSRELSPMWLWLTIRPIVMGSMACAIAAYLMEYPMAAFQ